MPNDDLTLELQGAKDDPRFTRAGDVIREKVYTYYLGKFGPFVFRTPLDPFDPQAFGRHVDEQRTHLRAIQRA